MTRLSQKRKAGTEQIRFRTRSALVVGGSPVTEFRIWHAGLNENQNGEPDLFDEKAAKMVLAAQEQHGVRVQIDLEHLSLDDRSPNFDPDSRGWCTLEVRRDANDGPELWAVDVKWTPDGERRLSEGTQLYASPAFYFDAENRPTRVLNIGLVAKPATDNAPLLAASERIDMRIDLFKVMAIAKVALAQVGKLKTYAEGGEVAGFKIVDLAAFLGVDIDPGDDPAGFITALKSKLADLVAKLDGTSAPPATPDDAMPAEEMAAAKEMMHLDNLSTLVETRANYVRYRDAYIRSEETTKKLKAEREAIEKKERADLCATLLKTGREDEDTIKDLATLSIERLRERAKKAVEQEALEQSVPHAGAKRLKEAPKTGGTCATLTKRDVAIAKDMKLDEAKFAEIKARVDERRAALRAAIEEG